MTDKQTYWLVDETGKKALVTSAAERDRWVPLGWADATEPTGNEFVNCWADGIDVPAVFPAASLEVWTAKGWKPGPPERPVSAFDDDQLPAPAATIPKPTTPAAGGDTKGK